MSPSGARDEADEEVRARAEEARASALDYVEQLLEAYFMQVLRLTAPCCLQANTRIPSS